MPTVKYEPKTGDHLECEHGGGCCWQQWNGVDSLEEGDGRHALTVLSFPPPNVVTKTVLPKTDELAWAMFTTDRDVSAFLATVADGSLRTGPGLYSFKWGSLERAQRIAWHRDEQGWRTSFTRRAGQILDNLNRYAGDDGPECATPTKGNPRD